MKSQWFKGKRITVFGIGLLGGGVGTIRYLTENGAHVIATDIKSREKLKESLEKLKDIKNVTYVLGQHRREDFMNVDMVIKTPSCPWTNEHVKLALLNKIPVETDASLFFQLCNVPIIGITGTKGKTTTARMIYHILKNGKKTPILFGVENIAILDRLSYVKKNTIVVFELSSWRLSALKYCKISPHIAVFTNIFPDHMDYYKSMDEYLDDKKQIYLHQKAMDYYIYSASDERLQEVVDEIPSRVIAVGHERITNGYSVFIEDGDIYYNDGIDARKFVSLDNISVRGAHNRNNLLLSIGAAHAIGMTLPEIEGALGDLPIIAHRLEFVREIEGVQYYNDTAATNPDAAIAGIATFDRPLILLAGGADKNLPVDVFAKEILTKTKKVIFFKGTATDRIINAIRKALPENEKKRLFEIVESMEEAVETAQKISDPGDVILLSPGASSFGIFVNEFDRGNQFRNIVKKIQ